MTKLFTILISSSLLFISSCTRIGAGYEGIKISQYGSEKGIQDIALVTGRVWYNPLTHDVEQYPIFVQTIDYPAFSVNAKDGSEFKVDPTLSYLIVAGNAPKIFGKYRKPLDEITNTTIFNYVKDSFRLVMNNYTTDEIVSNRTIFEENIQKHLSETLDKEGFKLEQLTSGLKYPETIVAAVNSKNEAVQQAFKVENEIKIAQAEARKKIVQAEAESQVLMIQAEAQRKANEAISASLNDLLIQRIFIEKWNGHTPLYGNAPVLFKNIKD